MKIPRSFRLPEQLVRTLERVSKATRIPEAALVEDALTYHWTTSPTADVAARRATVQAALSIPESAAPTPSQPGRRLTEQEIAWLQQNKKETSLHAFEHFKQHPPLEKPARKPRRP